MRRDELLLAQVAETAHLHVEHAVCSREEGEVSGRVTGGDLAIGEGRRRGAVK